MVIFTENEIEEFIRQFYIYNDEGWIVMEELLECALDKLRKRRDEVG